MAVDQSDNYTIDNSDNDEVEKDYFGDEYTITPLGLSKRKRPTLNDEEDGEAPNDKKSNSPGEGGSFIDHDGETKEKWKNGADDIDDDNFEWEELVDDDFEEGA